MLKFNVKYQEKYSRSEAFLRALFGWIYIGIPHFVVIYFLSIASTIVSLLTWFAILFTGKFPKSFFDFQVGYYLWYNRLVASLFGMVDGYPAFSLEKTENDMVELEIEYQEEYSRGKLFLVSLFGWLYAAIPHLFVLIFYSIAVTVLTFLGFWVVIFTGKFPETWHKFIEKFLRWNLRLALYLNFMYKNYPPFNGEPDTDQKEPN